MLVMHESMSNMTFMFQIEYDKRCNFLVVGHIVWIDVLKMRETRSQKETKVTFEAYRGLFKSGEPVALIKDLFDLKNSDGSCLDDLSHSTQSDGDDVRVSSEIVSDINSNDCWTTKAGIPLDSSKPFGHPIAVPGEEVLLGQDEVYKRFLAPSDF